MARTGRPPKPTALKIIEGNRGRRELPANEVKPASDHVACPSWLGPYAKREWRRLAGQVTALGLLTNVDLGKMAGYCAAIGDVRMFTAILRKEGDTWTDQYGGIHARPERRMLENAWTRVHAFGSEFGFSPVSRAKLAMPAKQEDPLDALLG